MKKPILATTIAALCIFAANSAGAEGSGSFNGEVRDAWITGRIESMYLLNEHLSPFSINTEVEDGVVTLTGTVPSDIDRDLAGALAGNLDGVIDVNNELVVDLQASQPNPEQATARRDFGTWVDDATTTAAVKSRLIRNPNTKGLQIDVDTNDDVVTLSGRVSTAEERSLAEQIALQGSDVTEVRNNLVVDTF